MGISSGTPWTGVLLIPLGMIIGPVLGISFPFSATFKGMYVITLLASVLLMGLGLRYRARPMAQMAVVLGVVLWTLAGLVGLGTAD